MLGVGVGMVDGMGVAEKAAAGGFERVVGKLFYRCEWAALSGAGKPEHNHVDFIRIRCINGNGTDGNVLFLIAEPPHRGAPTALGASQHADTHKRGSEAVSNTS